MLLHRRTRCHQANGLLGLVCIYLYGVNSEPGSGLVGVSKHLGVPWSGFHQHPNTNSLRCSCFPLSLGSNPWRSQSREGSELSSPPVHTKRRLPAHLDLHVVMQPFGCPKCQQQTGVWVSAQPKESSKARGAAETCCVTFLINFLVESGLFLAVILYKEHL